MKRGRLPLMKWDRCKSNLRSNELEGWKWGLRAIYEEFNDLAMELVGSIISL